MCSSDLTGELLGRYGERPLELGRVTETPLDEGKYQVKVEYPDKSYVVETELNGPYRVVRDVENRLYVIADSEKTALRYADGGTEEGRFKMPEDESIVTPNPTDFTTGVDEVLVIQYGSITVGPDGSIYTWARTPTHYKILKWSWVGTANGAPKAERAKGKTGAQSGEKEAAKPPAEARKKK